MKTADEVRKLAAARRAAILAHHYQVEEVKAVADYTGDSYGLACVASKSDAAVIVLCGVRFMAEGVSILAPEKKVLMPVPEAGCPLADTITPGEVMRLKEEHPGVPVVAYVNTSAEVKALSDYCCTSANAVAVVREIDAPRVIFLPDANLADWVAHRSGKEIIPWKGHCHVHHRVRAEDIRAIRKRHPRAVFIAHPECRPEVVAMADEVASTAGFFPYVASSPATEIIVGTEDGILGRLRRENPGKIFIPARPDMVCPNMKMTTLEDVREAIEKLQHEVAVEPRVAGRARRALERMVAITG